MLCPSVAHMRGDDKMKKALAISAALGLTLTLSGCWGDTKKDAAFSCKDATAAPVDGGAQASNCHAPTHLTVFWMPDGFRNVAFGCNGKVGIYVTSRGWVQNGSGDLPSLPSSISTVQDDPNCP